MRKVTFYFGILIIYGIAGFGCEKKETNESGGKTFDTIPGPITEKVDTDIYQTVYYVSAKSGSDEAGEGSREHPWRSPGFALGKIKDAGNTKRYAVFVSGGEYAQPTLQLIEFVDLFGGFNDADWSRDLLKYPTYLNGAGKQRVIIGADHTTIDGFVITKGVVRGQGGGIYCNNTSPTISNNVFWQNKTLSPQPWKPEFWHETAYDGGAVFCSNGSAAIIRQNLFVENSTENGRGAGLACQKECKPLISGNVFIENTSGLNDPMRSSDGGAVSVFDWCDARIENNIFLSNSALASNDGGGLFVALWSTAEISGNLFVDNHATDDAGGLFVGGQEHRYDRPLDPIPPEEKFFVSIHGTKFFGNSNKSMNSGAMRFTMESRGSFTKNVTAFNNGIYFQRSEVKVSENIILDDFLFIETKEGLKPGEISNNLIWAEFDLQIGATVRDNRIKNISASNENQPEFLADGIDIVAGSVIYHPKRFRTRIYLNGQRFRANELAGRVIRAGAKWGVIRSNDRDTITVWGDMHEAMTFTILSSYTLK